MPSSEFDVRKDQVINMANACINNLNNQLARFPEPLQVYFGYVAPPLTIKNVITMIEGSRVRIALLKDEYFNEGGMEYMTSILAMFQTLVNEYSANLDHSNIGSFLTAFTSTIEYIRSITDPILLWNGSKEMIETLGESRRKLQRAKADIDVILHNEEQLRQRVTVINHCYEETRDLPEAMLDAYANTKKIEELFHKTSSQQISIEDKLKEVDDLLAVITSKRDDSIKIVEQCEDNQRITSTIGLAAGFDKKAKSLSWSMIAWVVGLTFALGIGSWVASNSFKHLEGVLRTSNISTGMLIVNCLVAALSLGAPIWFCWLATKQINQRFRLSEDYSFKATIAKAYEGYKKEAVNMDQKFSEKLFDTALTRLDEAPLRLVKDEQAGSPWHELLTNKSFQKWLKRVPDPKEVIESIIANKKD